MLGGCCVHLRDSVNWDHGRCKDLDLDSCQLRVREVDGPEVFAVDRGSVLGERGYPPVVQCSVSGVDVAHLEVHMIKGAGRPLVQRGVMEDELDQLPAWSREPKLHEAE